jgi:hypothetical protein
MDFCGLEKSEQCGGFFKAKRHGGRFSENPGLEGANRTFATGSRIPPAPVKQGNRILAVITSCLAKLIQNGAFVCLSRLPIPQTGYLGQCLFFVP